MTSQIIIGAALILGPVILVGSVAIGIFGFSPEKAQAIRSAEDNFPTVIEEIRAIHIAKPERFRHERLDRHPAYLSLHFAVLAYAVCTLCGATPTSNIAALSVPARMIMATCFLIGSTLVLLGALMGARFGETFTILKGIHDNITSARLGNDVRLPYTFSCSGLMSIAVAMAIYASTSFNSTLGSLGGWMTGCSVIMCVVLICMFVDRIRRYSRTRALLIGQAITRIERAHDAE
jgi:hypothetical protein